VAKEYVEVRDGGYRLAGSRVSLDSIVYGYLRGESAESIAESFPAVTLELVYGAIAYYLANRAEIDEYLRAQSEEYERLRKEARAARPAFYAKLEAARRSSQRPA